MLRFIIRPLEPSIQPAETDDAAGILVLVAKMGCTAADIERDGTFAFSVRLGDSGLWSISQGPLQRTSGRRAR